MTWVAVQTEDAAGIFDRLEVRPSDIWDEWFESPLAGAALTNGWYLLVGRGCDHAIGSPETATSLSELGDVVVCTIEEHVMWSSAAYWSAGASVWTAQHDAQNSIFDLESSGDLPEDYGRMRDEARSEQEQAGGQEADVDYTFDVPLTLAKSITGFRHDDDPGQLFQAAPVELHLLNPPPRPWWKFW